MKLRLFVGLLGALALVFATFGAAAADTSTGSVALHSGGGGSCSGQDNGAGVGNIQYVLRGSQLTVTVNLQGANPNTTYDVFRRCVAGIGLISTNGSGNGSATFVVNGWSTNASIDLNIHGTNGAGHIGGGTMSYTRDTTPPVISNVPGNISAPAQNASGAVVSYNTPTATDNVDGPVGVTCNPASGSTFPIGATTVTCSASDTGGNTSIASFTVTVTKLDQTISFGALADKTFGDADFAVSASASSGLGVSFSTSGNCVQSSPGTVAIGGAGSCTVTASQPGDATYNAAASVSQTFAIAKATPVVTWPHLDAVIYGTALGPGQLNASANVSGSFGYSSGIGAVLPAGSQQLSATFTPNDAANYNGASATNSLSVFPAPLLVTTDPSSKLYGAPNPAFTVSYNGFVNGGDGAASLGGTLSFTTAATTSSPVGSYDVTPSGVTSANYTISFAAGTLTVTPATTRSATSDVTATFGDAGVTLSATVANRDTTAAVNEGAVTFTVTQGSATIGLVGGNVANGAASATFNLGSVNAGSYTVTATYVDGATPANFQASGATATLTINKAASKTAVTVPSNVTYDALPHSASATTTGVGGATIAAPVVSYTPGSGVPTSAGSYTAGTSFAGDDNYLPSGDSQTYTIGKAPLAVTAANATRAYGAANPAFTGAITGIQGADPITASYSTAATQASGAGSYAIVPALSDGGSGKLANYSVTSANGTLTISPVPLTVTANPSTKIYGAANPAFSVSYSGFVNGDGVASLAGTLTFTTAATTSSPVGSYDVTPGGLTNGNYTISFVKGTLTVTSAKTATAASNATATFGDAGVTLSATVANSDTAAAVNEGTVTFTVTQGSATIGSASGNISGGAASATFSLGGVNAGSYTVTAAYADGASPANFQGSSATATLTINKAASKTTVTVPSNVTYDALPHSASATTTGVGGATVASPVVSYGPGSGVPTSAGSYTASASFAGNGNYLPSSDSKPYSIAKATPTLAWATPADIIVGTALGSAQLNATASFQGHALPGTFTYTPAAGTVLARGSGQVLSVRFAAADGTDFNVATAQVTINVDYTFSFLPPLGANQQPFGVGQTIPVKFVLTNAQGQQVRTAVATLAVDGAPVAGQFVVNGNHYQLNLSTTGLAAGPHTLTVSLDDGSTHSDVVTLVAA